MSQRYTKVTQDIAKSLAKYRKEIPETMKGFSALHDAANTEGGLDKKTKELIAIAIALRCEGCIAFHAQALAKLGVNREAFMETMAVAIYMGGGPSLMTPTEALMAFEEFSGQES